MRRYVLYSMNGRSSGVVWCFAERDVGVTDYNCRF